MEAVRSPQLTLTLEWSLCKMYSVLKAVLVVRE